jgi:hypothetical protein
MPTEDVVCPVCGGTEWQQGEEPYMLRPGNPRYVRGGGDTVIAFFCVRCDFIRLHRAAEPRDE